MASHVPVLISVHIAAPNLCIYKMYAGPYLDWGSREVQKIFSFSLGLIDLVKWVGWNDDNVGPFHITKLYIKQNWIFIWQHSVWPVLCNWPLHKQVLNRQFRSSWPVYSRGQHEEIIISAVCDAGISHWGMPRQSVIFIQRLWEDTEECIQNLSWETCLYSSNP